MNELQKSLGLASLGAEILEPEQHQNRRRPLFPLPAFVLRAALGELATVMLDSQHLVPERLTEATFQFAYPTLSQALSQLLRERGGSPVE